jgi:hypothetical protein
VRILTCRVVLLLLPQEAAVKALSSGGPSAAKDVQRLAAQVEVRPPLDWFTPLFLHRAETSY